MERSDGRTLTKEALAERRRKAVKLREAGMLIDEVARHCELSRTTVIAVCRAYRAGGWAAVALKARGRPEGAGRKLTDAQEAEVKKLIRDATPDKLKMPFALWSRGAVLQLVRERYGVKLTAQGIGKYLARWGFTPQKPIKRAYEQSPQAVRQWLDTEYPGIEARAKAAGAEIHWGDETGLRSDDVRGRSYAPAGQTPVIRVTNRREGLSVISSVTNQGKVRWKVFEGAINADILIDFMKRLVKDADRKVFLVLDNLKVHHAKPVKAWLQDNKEKIAVFFLPSYSPELNPDEMLNADLKAAVTRRAPARAKGQLKKATISHLRRLQKSPRRVKSFFQHDPVKDAA